MTGRHDGPPQPRAHARAGVALSVSAGRRSKGVSTLVALAVAVSLISLTLGLWTRASSAPLWPAVLTDWTLGSCLLCLTATGVGAVVATRLRRNAVGWSFLALGVLTGLVFGLRWYTTLAISDGVVAPPALWAAWLFAVAIPVNMTCLALVALLFPHGRPPSRRWRPVTALTVLVGVVAAASQAVSPYHPDQTQFPQLPNPMAILPDAVGLPLVSNTSTLLFASLLAALVALSVRARRSRGIERQQIKWFVFAAIVAFSTLFIGFWSEPAFVVATLAALPAVPIAAGIAVLRYRLYDIDRIISRTLAYVLLTIVLGAIYLGGVTIVAATSPVADNSPLSVAASTLAAAAAFGPARRRIQSAVDQRFNRARYDAAKTAEAYRSRLRDQLELATIGEDLAATVRATVAPTSVSVWLTTPGEGS